MMHVTLLLSGYFRTFHHGQREVVVVVPAGETTARQAAASVGLPEKDIGFIMRDGQRLCPDTPLRDGDAVGIYPEILGG